ncbi:hypothetical protein SAMN05444005_10370 [Flavobacterium urocaniciphilum]|uniref:Uncharacterized protein n=1 Tax=Flavobacterium urocaniciphilum TaxID=1299341 RepID=A0A1H9BL56_9FLAO|nr:hypothetical protein SAMN05444005_10370 [Flavobacterium urocaniciphilum]
MKNLYTNETTTPHLHCKDMLRFCGLFKEKSTLTLLTEKNAKKQVKISQY